MFAMFDPYQFYQGPLLPEVKPLQAFSKVNGVQRKHWNSSTSIRPIQNLPLEKWDPVLSGDQGQISSTTKSRSISDQRGGNTSSGTTVATAHSKTTLNRKEVKNNLPQTSRQSSPRRRDEVSKDNVEGRLESKAPDFSTPSKSPYSAKKQGSYSSSHSARKIEDRAIGDALFSCPFELVEIYPCNKDSSFNRRFSDASRKGSSMRSFPKEDDESSKSSVLGEDVFSKVGSSTFNSTTHDGNSVNSSQSGISKWMLDLNNSSVYEHFGTDLASMENPITDKRDKKPTEKRIMNVDSLLSMKSTAVEVKEKRLESERRDVGADMSSLRDAVIDAKEKRLDSERRRVDADMSSLNMSSIETTKIKESTPNSVRRRVDTNNVSSVESTVNDTKEKRPDSSMKNTVINSSEFSPMNSDRKNEKSIKVIIEKRKPEKSDVSSEEILPKKSKIDTTLTGDPEKKMGKLLVEDFESLNVEQSTVNYGDAKICKLLTKIYEQLSSDWERMESIRMKQHGDVSVDSICSKMTLRLLNSTIQRCRSYIYGANDSFKAESELTELFSQYVVQLVNAVNKNKLVIEEHECRLEPTQPELLQKKSANEERRILNDDATFWDRWTREIGCVIGSIFSSIERVIAVNEEKENVPNPRQYKSTNRRATNMVANDRKQKHGVIPQKITKVNLAKKESSIETQMYVLNSNNQVKQSKSKTSTKHVITPRSRESKLASQEAVQSKIVEKRTNDKGRLAKKPTLSANFNQSKQPISRQKHRASSNSQPVWRPGGSVKLPSSSSATTLMQKYRPFCHTKEKTNQPNENIKMPANKRGDSLDRIVSKKNLLNVEKTVDDNGKRTTKMCNNLLESKQRRVASESKKRVSQETYSMKDMVSSLEPDGSKVSSKRSNASLKTSPRLKLRPGILRASSKGYEPLHHSESACSKKCEKTSSWEKMGRQKSSKESRVLQVLEDIIKSTPIEKTGDKNAKNIVDCYRVRAETYSPRLEEPTGIKQDNKIHEEVPTRDVDSMLHKNDHLIRKLPEPSLTHDFAPLPIVNDKEDVKDVRVGVDLKTSPPYSSFISVASASCMADFSSSSDCATAVESSKCCQTSFNSIPSATLNLEQKEEKSGRHDNLQVSFIDRVGDPQECNKEKSKDLIDKQKSKNASVVEEETFKDLPVVRVETLKPPAARQEKSKCPSPTKEEKFSLSPVTEKKSKTNPHSLSLTILKEFLCSQGVDVDLVNKAEQCLKDKQKTRKCSRKSVSSVDSTVQDVTDSSVTMLEEVTESNAEDSSLIGKQKVISMVSNQFVTKKLDAATCTERNISDASSQTSHQWSTTKSLQTIPEEIIFSSKKHQEMETQTEVTSAKHVVSECREKTPKEFKNFRNISSMTDSPSTSNNFTETIKVSYVSKSVATEVDFPKNPEEDCHNFNSPLMAVKVRDDKRVERTIGKDDHELNRLLNEMQCQDESSMHCELDASTSFLDLSSECLTKHSNETEDKESNKSLVKVLSSETIAALQIAAIRAQNVYKAIGIYKQSLEGKLKKLENQTKRKKTEEENVESCKELLKTLYNNPVVTKSCDRFDSDYDIEPVEALRKPEVVFTSSETSIERVSKSDEAIFKAISTPTVNASIDEDVLDVIESSSSVVLKDVKSLVEFLIHETEDAKVNQIYCIQKIPNGLRFRSREKSLQVEKKLQNEFSMFSRESVLPLVYGIVCSFVFWCLQFTISCDSIL